MVLTRGQASAAENASHEPNTNPDRSSGKNKKAKRHNVGATKGDHALAVIASVDAGGEDPQEQLKKPHKQMKLFDGDSHDLGGSKPTTASDAAVKIEQETGHLQQQQHKQQQQQQWQQEEEAQEDKREQQPLKQTGLKAVAAEPLRDNAQGDVPSTAQQEHTGVTHVAKRKGHHCSSGPASDSQDGNRADGQHPNGAVHKSVVLDKSDHPVAMKRDGRKNQQVEAAKEATEKLEPRIVNINRAPTLTLWVKVVAEREGFSEDTAATFGRAIAGMLAQSRGRSLGMFSETDKAGTSQAKSSKFEKATVFGMAVKVEMSHGTTVAVAADGKSIQPKQALGYLSRSFGEDLGRTQKALETLAAAYSPEDIGKQAYRLYEKFRPDAGWGQKGDLDLNFIEALAKAVDA